MCFDMLIGTTSGPKSFLPEVREIVIPKGFFLASLFHNLIYDPAHLLYPYCSKGHKRTEIYPKDSFSFPSFSEFPCPGLGLIVYPELANSDQSYF